MIAKFSFLLVAFACGVSPILAQAKCQKCMMSNDAYCIDETSYYLCLDGNNPTNGTRSKCPSGQVCTDSLKICEPQSGSGGVSNRPACSSTCGECPASTALYKLYTCVSRTQFGRCVQNAVTLTAKCGDGQICSSELYAKTGKICAPQCVADFYDVSPSCDSNEIVTTTTTRMPPVDTESLKRQCVNASPNFPTRNIFYIPNANDNECKTYIFCEKFENKFDGLLVKCVNGNYFNPSTQKCGTVRPTQCNLQTTTTETPTSTTTVTSITETTQISPIPTTMEDATASSL